MNIDNIISTLEAMPLAERVDALNEIREKLHNVSRSSLNLFDFVKWVPNSIVARTITTQTALRRLKWSCCALLSIATALLNLS